jgi:hypothetical protein
METQAVEMLTLISSLCYVVLINVFGVVVGVRKQRLALYTYLGHLSRFHLKTETESSLRNVVF